MKLLKSLFPSRGRSPITAQCVLPAELVSHILCYVADPRDVMRWRTGSVPFDSLPERIRVDVRYSRSRSGSVPSLTSPRFGKSFTPMRPTLVHLFRVPPNLLSLSIVLFCGPHDWPGHGRRAILRLVSRFEMPFYGETRGRGRGGIQLVGGRWLVVRQSNQCIVLYDTDATDTRVTQILWGKPE